MFCLRQDMLEQWWIWPKPTYALEEVLPNTGSHEYRASGVP